MHRVLQLSLQRVIARSLTSDLKKTQPLLHRARVAALHWWFNNHCKGNANKRQWPSHRQWHKLDGVAAATSGFDALIPVTSPDKALLSGQTNPAGQINLAGTRDGW